MIRLRSPYEGAVLAVLLVFAANTVCAASLVFKIRVVNPSQTESRPVKIRRLLPAGLRGEDIVDAGGLDVGYDVKQGRLYVGKETDLPPGAVQTYEVEMKDIWTVDPARIEAVRAHAAELAAKLPDSSMAQELRASVEARLAALEERQGRFALGKVRAVEHIGAHEANEKLLDAAESDIGRLENLVIGEGLDPGRFLGTLPEVAPQPSAPAEPPEDMPTATFRVRVHNPSERETQTARVRRLLPREIKPDDVLESGGLQVGYDFDANRCYVYQDDVEVAPGQSREFEVVVRNRWVLDDAWLTRLEQRTTNLVARAEGSFDSIVNEAEKILARFRETREQVPPGELNEEYINFFRVQEMEFRLLERRIVRLEELMTPKKVKRPIFDAEMLKVQPPSTKTTWIIIYIILGFLMLVSLLFFLRWYAKSSP